MAKISQSLGFSFKLDPDSSQSDWARVDFEVAEVDMERPFGPQIGDDSEELNEYPTSEMVWDFVKQKMDDRIDAIMGPE
tara:strand:+ start:15045 stop:15281 length:237 start_codon:yes stop_codon:yes gene_type:complete